MSPWNVQRVRSVVCYTAVFGVERYVTILKTAVLQATRSRERRLHCQAYKFPTFLKTFDDKSPKVGTRGLKLLHEKSVGGGWARFKALKPRANGRNIVRQQLPTLLDVACCVCLHTLLGVVSQSLKPVTPSKISVVPWDRRNVAQQCMCCGSILSLV